MNPLARLRDYRWRKRVEWFAEAAYRARRQRGGVFGPIKTTRFDLVRKEFDWAVDFNPRPGECDLEGANR